MMSPTTLELVRRVGQILGDPAAALGLEAALSVEITLLLKDVSGCPALVITGRPGGAKTTAINCARGARHSVYYTDAISPHSFVSHYAAKTPKQLQDEVDLLPRIRNHCVQVSDLTPLLTAPEPELRETMGVLTRILEGEGYRSDKGVHGQRGYGGLKGEDWRFVMVAASTPFPGRLWRLIGNLGPRLLTLSVEQATEIAGPPQRGHRDRVEKIAELFDEWMAAAFMKHGLRNIIWDSQNEQVEHELWALATFVTCMRAPLPLAGDPVVSERPLRLYEALHAVARGHALLDERRFLRDDDLSLVRRIALDSMPEDRRRLVRILLVQGFVTAAEAAEVLGMTELGATGHLGTLETRVKMFTHEGSGNRGDAVRWKLILPAGVTKWAPHWAEAAS